MSFPKIDIPFINKNDTNNKIEIQDKNSKK
jgi:hypothetical protein